MNLRNFLDFFDPNGCFLLKPLHKRREIQRFCPEVNIAGEKEDQRLNGASFQFTKLFLELLKLSLDLLNGSPEVIIVILDKLDGILPILFNLPLLPPQPILVLLQKIFDLGGGLVVGLLKGDELGLLVLGLMLAKVNGLALLA